MKQASQACGRPPRQDMEFQRIGKLQLWTFKMTDRAKEMGQKDRQKEATKLYQERTEEASINTDTREGSEGAVNHSVK